MLLLVFATAVIGQEKIIAIGTCQEIMLIKNNLPGYNLSLVTAIERIEKQTNAIAVKICRANESVVVTGMDPEGNDIKEPRIIIFVGNGQTGICPPVCD